ncbi:MAG: phage protease [Acidobacteriia bacterium]|nr:phage protease [Terriglobia bacterium]
MLGQIQNPTSKIQNPPGTWHLTPDTCSLPRFVVTLEAPAESAGLLRVPLALTGKWVRGSTTFAITRQDLEDIVRNFRERQNGEINVDYDHASEMPEVAAGGPVPSAGRIVKLDSPEVLGAGDWGLGEKHQHPAPSTQHPAPSTRFILWGWYEPTERARELLKSREYRYISPAVDWAAQNKRTGKPQGTTLTSVALTNRPFLEELPQIRLSDPAFQAVDEPANAGTPSENPKSTIANSGGPMKQVNLSVADGKIRLAHDDFKDEYFLDPEELKRCMHELGLMSEVTLAGPTLAEPSAVITLAQARSLLSEAAARGKAVPASEVFRGQVEQELEAALKAGKILPRQRDDWRKIALADFPTFRKIVGMQKPLVPIEPLGFSGTGPTDVQAQVKFLAEQRMRERHLSFGQALSEIGREQPDLVQQYRRAVSGNE